MKTTIKYWLKVFTVAVSIAINLVFITMFLLAYFSGDMYTTMWINLYGEQHLELFMILLYIPFGTWFYMDIIKKWVVKDKNNG